MCVIIGVDHGYASIKTANTVFPSGVVAFDAPPPVLHGLLEYEGHFYVCGSGRQPLVKDKTINESYYLLTLAAIAKELKYRSLGTTAEIILAVGLPLTGFGRDRNTFRDYLLKDGQPIEFHFEGIEYEVTIVDVQIMPQAYSAIAVNQYLLNGEPSIIVTDIGGWTVDVMRLDRKIVDTSTCRSLEFGVIRCMDEIKEQVRRTAGLSVTDAQVESVLTGAPCSLDARVSELIRKHGRLYVQKLISAIEEGGFDLKAIPTIFMGGGASLVKPRVSPQDGLCRIVYLEDVCLNAKAFEAIVRQKLRQ